MASRPSGGRRGEDLRPAPPSSSFLRPFEDLVPLPSRVPSSLTVSSERRNSLAALAAKQPSTPLLPVVVSSLSNVSVSPQTNSQVYSDVDWALLAPASQFKPEDEDKIFPSVFNSLSLKPSEERTVVDVEKQGGHRNKEPEFTTRQEPRQSSQTKEFSLSIVPSEVNVAKKEQILPKRNPVPEPIPVPLPQAVVPVLPSLPRSVSPNAGPSWATDKQESPSLTTKSTCETSTDGSSPVMVKSRSTESSRARASGHQSRYYPPVRDAVNWERPVALEVRPRPRPPPLKQASNKVRLIACTTSTVCTAADDGLRLWNLAYAMDEGSAPGRDPMGEEDAAVAVLCEVRDHRARVLSLTVDEKQGMLWSGHADGSVRVWPLLEEERKLPRVADFLFEWPAHPQPVTALTITSYGELWTGSKGGSMRAWPFNALTRALAECRDGGRPGRVCHWLAGEGHNLKPNFSYADSSGRLHSEVRFLFTERARGRVWSGGQHSVAIWNAQNREFVAMVGSRWQSEFPGLVGRGASAGREKFTETSRDRAPARIGMLDNGSSYGAKGEDKDKKKFGWKQLREGVGKVGGAVNGAVGAVGGAVAAAEAVRRDARRLMALAWAPDGSVWVACATGLLQHFDPFGKFLAEVTPWPAGLRCLVAVGMRIWAGYSDGKILVLSEKSGRKLASWDAHKGGVMQLAVCGDHVISVAAHGGLKAWAATSPSPMDNILQSVMAERADEYTKIERTRVVAATWNVGEKRPPRSTLEQWLGPAVSGAGIVAVGLQEMEMGAGTIAIAAAKESVGMGLKEKVNANAQLWLSDIQDVLREQFKMVLWRQLAGMLIGVWVANDLLPHVGDVETGAVACGFGRTFGNKGAVAVRMSVFRRTMCFVACHLAAHQEAVGRRDEDWLRIYDHMVFGRTMGTMGTAASSMARVAGVQVKSAVQGILRVAQGASAGKRGMSRLMVDEDDQEEEIMSDGGFVEDSEEKEGMLAETPERCELSEVDLLVWMGDFNYRLDGVTYERAVQLISQKRLGELFMSDQLKKGMDHNRAFLGMREAPICFPPTYKFDRGDSSPLAYDSSEKRRVPAWCDRILLRDSGTADMATLKCPVQAAVKEYDACMEAMESDHKPVRCVMDVQLAGVNEAARRRLYGRLFAPPGAAPEVRISPKGDLWLNGTERCVLRLTNKSKEPVIFTIWSLGLMDPSDCGHPRQEKRASQLQPLSGGLPLWLEVSPASGVIPPEQTVNIDVFHSKGLWADKPKPKATTLVLEARHAFSVATSQQSIYVSHGVTANHVPRDRDPTASKPPSSQPFRSLSQPDAESAATQHTSVPDTLFFRSSSADGVTSVATSPANLVSAQPPSPPKEPVFESLPDLLSWN